MNARSVLIDYVYRPYPGVLVAQARRRGLVVIDGLDVLENQLRSQFHCLTGGTIAAGIIESELQQYRGKREGQDGIVPHVSVTQDYRMA